jgi:hypothetical protein
MKTSGSPLQSSEQQQPQNIWLCPHLPEHGLEPGHKISSIQHAFLLS